MVKIASWNVNSIKPRLDNALSWLRAVQPDVLCLQEIKCVDEAFPKDAFADLGYNVATHGQKTYNGVAILSKWPIDEAIRGLPGSEGQGRGEGDDSEARYLEAVISLNGAAIRVASIYLPNGNPADTEKYPYKLAWMARLKAHAAELLRLEEPLALAGDYNVIPEPEDVHNPAAWTEDALFKTETRRAYRELLNLGLTDALRACDGSPHRYTFWDYQAGAWQKDWGLRIDHILLSPQAAARLKACEIDKTPRGWEKPSDHTPIWAELAL
jgi:exodeoxyribonuclease III